MKYLLTFLLALSVAALYAQPGTVDNTYGTDKTGTVSVSQLYTQAAAMYPGDKELTGGYSSTLVSPADRGFLLARRLKDGSPDTAFGIAGQITTKVDDIVDVVRSLGWTGIAVQPDGKIIAAGGVGWNNPDYPKGYFVQYDIDIVLARFLPDGTPDESFGKGGRVVTNLGLLENITAVAVQPDGKIVVSGYQSNEYVGAEGYHSDILIARYNTDGSLDESFGEYKGFSLDPYGFEFNYGYALLLQPDGRMVVGGSSYSGGYFYMIRYLPNGMPDKSFGINGSVETSFSVGGAQINSLALDNKERIVAAGTVGSVYTGISRYLPDGSLDNSFDEDGKLMLDYSNYPATASAGCQALVQPDNKLVVVSQVSDIPNGYPGTLTLSGLNEDGSKDASFGTDKGQTITNIEMPSFPTDVNAAQQSDGKIVVSGNGNSYGLLARFNGYPVHVSLAVRIKHYLQNHGITWNGLPAEDKVAYYSVEQSSRGTGFTPIAKLSGRSNLHDYSFTNSQLLQGTNYYRIKAVSTDGTIRYSEVASADNITNSASVYPNPAKSFITVGGLPSNETANISIKDGSGTVLSKGVSNGSTQYRSSLANLQPGTYYMNIITTGKTETLPFVKE